VLNITLYFLIFHHASVLYSCLNGKTAASHQFFFFFFYKYIMGKQYDCHKQKYYVPQNLRPDQILNLKQLSKKVKKSKSQQTKQLLGKKKKTALKLENRKGKRGKRNEANPEFKKNLKQAKKLKTSKRKGKVSGHW
jgi:hypothetical protein